MEKFKRIFLGNDIFPNNSIWIIAVLGLVLTFLSFI